MTAGKNPAGIYYLLAGGARRLRERTSWKNPADSYDRQHPRKKRPAEPERNGREKTCRHPPAGEARENSCPADSRAMTAVIQQAGFYPKKRPRH